MESETDTDALVREFCQHLFAESAEPVYRYFTLYENLMESMPLRAKNHEDWWVYPSSEAMEQGRQLLEEASSRARSEAVKQRVRKLQIGHRVYTIQWQAATARRAGAIMRAREADVQFAQMVQELQNSGQHDVIDMWLARHESRERGSDAQAYVELMTNAGYTTTEAREQAWREAQKEGAAFARKLGFITEWQVVGPFRCTPGELSKADIPVDAVNLSQKFPTLSGEGGWQQVSVNHPFGILDLHNMFSRDPWLSAYAACWAQLPGGPPAISLRVGSNDGAAVWLDGKPILVSDIPRGFQLDQDRVSVAGDGAGWHLLVVKVINHGNLWNLAVRFTDGVGRPLQIPTRATPPE